jgi:AcrR family transcriptional regulator
VAWTKAPEDERRQQILDAAVRVAGRHGLRGTTLRGVAAEAALSHGLVLFHFGSKQALVNPLLEAVLGWLAERSAPAGEVRGLGDLVAAEIAAVDPVRTAVLLDFWVLAATDAQVRARITAAIARYEAALAEVVEGDGAERERLAALATTVVFGAALRSLLDGGDDGLARELRAALPRA